MRIRSIVILVALSTLVVAAIALAAEDEQQQQQQLGTGVQPSAKKNFKMPKLFDMKVYMEKFNKNYPNAAELVRRTKLFMARAFAVFISGIKYMYNKGTKYLKINPRSDWTEAERDASLNYEGKRPSVRPTDDSRPVPAVDPEDIERIVETNPDLAKIAAELEGGDAAERQTRRKRSTDGVQKMKRQLSMNQLMGDSDEPLIVSPKYATSVPSNNPNYQQPEMFSEGVDDDNVDVVKAIPEKEAKKIDSVADEGGYLGFMFGTIKSAIDLLAPPPEQEQQGENAWGTKLKLLINGQIESEEELDDDFQEARDHLPDQVFLDYRDTGCVLQPKEQAKCGSCYIFSQTAVLEYLHCKQTGKLVPFSEQYAVDCGLARKANRMDGCDGGVEARAAEFYERYGMELSVDYPYKAKEQPCPYHISIGSKHMGHTRIRLLENYMVENYAELEPHSITRLLEVKGPLTISIKTPSDFSDYGGGVDILNCDTKKVGGHAMVIIGHGVEDGIEYFLIRNSYGIKFGLQGHYKMAKKVKRGCIMRIGFTKAVFVENKNHKGKTIFTDLKKQQLLAAFGPSAVAAA